MAKHIVSGVLHALKEEARLESGDQSYLLIPYPRGTPLSGKTRREMGLQLFGYLAGREIEIEGSLEDGEIWNARLAGGAAGRTARLPPSSLDRFSAQIQEHFQKDSREIAALLEDVGISAVAALYHRIRNDPEHEVAAFAKYLKVEEGHIRGFLDALQEQPKNRRLVAAARRLPVKRGVSLARLAELGTLPLPRVAPAGPPKFPASGLTPTLPSAVDLSLHMTPVKDQGVRGTCVAHAVAACLEADLVKKGKIGPKPDLSEQYLYWACKSLDGAPGDEGTFIEFAVQALLNGVASKGLPGGLCSEKDWPYNKLPKPRNEAQGPPPSKVLRLFDAGKQVRLLKRARLKASSIKSIKAALASGRCVAISVFTYPFWEDDYVWQEGQISLPLSIEPDGAHAICLVGYRDNDATHSDGAFIFKNSWDVTWGSNRPDPGYGTLPYRYILKSSIEAYSFEVL